MLRFDTFLEPREIASLAGFFILVNSLAGLAGLVATQRFELQLGLLFAVLVPVALGGWLGARIKNQMLRPGQIRLITAALVLFVGIRLLLKYL
ncbi:MAG: TSUP family transporter [Bacteroidetes bacterium]|nr:TSUP family transporter [Bacteroidota bacterium]